MPSRMIFRPQGLPTGRDELTAGEELFLACWRWWLLGLLRRNEGGFAAAWRLASLRLGPEPARALLDALALLVWQFGTEARRQIAVPPPCCLRIESDEARLLAALAAHQSGQCATAEALLERLCGGPASARLLQAAGAAAEALASGGMVLPQRGTAAPATAEACAPRAEPLSSLTLH